MFFHYNGKNCSVCLACMYGETVFSLQDRLASGVEAVGDEDVARALIAACKGSTELVFNTYDQLISSGVIPQSLGLKLRLLRSVLTVLREWAMSVYAQRMGTSKQGVRDKITSAANRSGSLFLIQVYHVLINFLVANIILLHIHIGYQKH